MQLAYRFFLFMCFPVVAAAAVAMWALYIEYHHHLEFNEEILESAQNDLKTELKKHEQQVSTISNLLSLDWSFIENLRKKDFDRLFVTTQGLYNFGGIYSWVLDKSLQVIVRGHDEFSFGDSLRSHKIESDVPEARILDGQKFILLKRKVDLGFGEHAYVVLGIPMNISSLLSLAGKKQLLWKLSFNEMGAITNCPEMACSFKLNNSTLREKFELGNVQLNSLISFKEDPFKTYLDWLLSIIVLLVLFISLLLVLSFKVIDRYLVKPMAQIVARIDDFNELDDSSVSEKFSEISEYKDVELALHKMQKGLLKKNEKIQESVEDLRMQKIRLDKENNLLRVLSHDISNPTTNIELAVRLLEKKDRVAEHGQKFLGQISQACISIKEIISHVRDMKAIESGRRELSLCPIDLEQVVAKVEDVFFHKLKDKNLQLVLVDKRSDEFRDKVFYAEPISFQNSVINNIVSNAIKFSYSDRSIRFLIADDSKNLIVSVCNTGKPLSEERAREIFVYEGVTTSKGTHGEFGTGFGMPVAHSYMEIYGGAISAETINNETRFNLTFPAIVVGDSKVA